MAGRGRGRGGSRGLTFSVETFGFGRGEALPTATAQPPETFPKLISKPLALRKGEEYEYMQAMKQQFLALAQKSPFYLVSGEKRKDIERYTDKYQLGQRNNTEWQPSDWSRFPAELKPKQAKVVKVKRLVQPQVGAAKRIAQNDKLTERLDELEKMDKAAVEEDEGQAKEEGEEEEQEEEEVEQEEEEEDNDYGETYFDNGEDYGADSGDDLEDGATYGY